MQNRRGATFMHVEDFSGVEKTGVENSNFLLEAIKSIGPSNVLQVVTDNAANCKAAGEEALANTIVLDSWKDWAKKGDENTQKIGQGTKIGEVYERMDNVVGEIKDMMKNVYTSYFLEVKKIVLARFSESYKEGPSKKWDMNPESAYLEGSTSRMEDMR
ncbi:hAT dimerization domain, ribonuclease H-like domain protein [Tanacetum coccineum]